MTHLRTVAVGSLLCLAALALGGGLPALRVKAAELVDPAGALVRLQGCNLGNWLMLEMWMLGLGEGPGAISDQHELLSILDRRFGPAEGRRLMDVYRESWVRDGDFATIKRFGMNAVRLPFDYRLLEDDAAPMKLRPGAWKWLDRAVAMAERHGLYVILDMHGAQGGQSVYDHTGQSGQNKLWGVPQNEKRYVWLWTQVARRYRSRGAVAAYDVLNEPYGGTHEQQVALMEKLVPAIRAVDPDKLIFLPSHYNGFAHYGRPQDRRWKAVGVTEHHYPGLFGNGEPNLTTHARFLKALELKAREVKALGVPYLVGEMNVVFRSAGDGAMMRRYWDFYRQHGWMATMWCYRAESREGGIGDACWAMVANRKPLRTIDLRKASKEAIERFFRGFASEEMCVNDALRVALTSKKAPELALPQVPDPVTSVPFRDRIEGWSVADVGGAREGGLRSLGDGRFELFGGGGDIWGRLDQFRFLYREVEGEFQLEATLEELADVAEYVKGGVMVRASLEPDAPAVLLSSFAGGELQLAVRTEKGGEMASVASVRGKLPRRLGLSMIAGTVTAYVGEGAGWSRVGEAKAPRFGPKALVGVVALSHDDRQLTKAAYARLRLEQNLKSELPR